MSDDGELIHEIYEAIDNNSVPLHLAVRLTPERLSRMWAFMLRMWNIDMLMVLRPVGLMRVAMTAAELVAERMPHGEPELWLAKAEAVIEGLETPDTLSRGLNTFAKHASGGSSEMQDRWALLHRALRMVSDYSSQRAYGNKDPARWQPVVNDAFTIVFRAVDLLPPSTFELVQRDLDALGPPTLEDIVLAAERGR